jgi:hypothetical protein
MVALPVAPLVDRLTAPVDARVPRSTVALAAVVVKLEVPVTVTVPESVMFPVVAVALRLPFTVEAAMSRAVVFTMVALPVVPAVTRLTAPVDARVSRSIVALAAVVVKLEVPTTVTVPESVIFPALAVAKRLRPIEEIPRSRAILFTTLASPVAPLVDRLTAPVDARVPRLIVALAAVVVKLEVPVTVTVPESVMFPVVAVALRLPFTVEVARSRAVVFTTLASPVAPLVDRLTAPVDARVPRSTVALAAVVVKLEVPVTVTVPESVMFPVVAVALRLPFTVEAARSRAVVFTMVALPVVPAVTRLTAPVDARVPRSIVALAAVVVKLEVPATVTIPESVIFPVLAVAKRLPLTVEVASTRAIEFVNWTVFAFVIVTAPVKAFSSPNVIVVAPVENVAVPGIVRIPVCVNVPELTSRFPPTARVTAGKSSAEVVLIVSPERGVTSPIAPPKESVPVTVVTLSAAVTPDLSIVLPNDTAPPFELIVASLSSVSAPVRVRLAVFAPVLEIFVPAMKSVVVVVTVKSFPNKSISPLLASEFILRLPTSNVTVTPLFTMTSSPATGAGSPPQVAVADHKPVALAVLVAPHTPPTIPRRATMRSVARRQRVIQYSI